MQRESIAIKNESNQELEELKQVNEVCRSTEEALLCESEKEKFKLGEILEVSDQTIEEHRDNNTDMRQKLWKAIRKIKEKSFEVEVVEEENDDSREKLENAEEELNVMRRKCAKERRKCNANL